MEKAIRINHAEETITLYSGFAKRASIYGTAEYIELQKCRKDHPNYKVITRRIKKNPHKQKYDGLTYDYMKDYILSNNPTLMPKFIKMRNLGKSHKASYTYPTIKKWFLDSFPEIRDFGMEKESQKTETKEIKAS